MPRRLPSLSFANRLEDTRKQIKPWINMKRRTKDAKTQTDDKVDQTAAQPKPQAPTTQQIRKRAYEIFEARGGEPGRELDDWLLAENEVKAEIERQRESPVE
jgi:hypothetical protein